MHRRYFKSETVYDSRALTQADEDALIQAARDVKMSSLGPLVPPTPQTGINLKWRSRTTISEKDKCFQGDGLEEDEGSGSIRGGRAAWAWR
jgi:hypothetical protein